MDLDKSGFIENSEVEQLLREVYEDVPPFEVATFVELFDTDGDGRISWDEFIAGLGGNTDGTNADLSSLLLIAGSDGPGGPEPKLSGTVTVEMDDGSKVEMDASSYMEQLKAEASALRNELAQAEQAKVKEELALSTSISAYVSSLPDAQLKLLTSGISDDVVAAMKQLVTFILRAPDGEGLLPKTRRSRWSRRAAAAVPLPACARLSPSRGRGHRRGDRKHRQVDRWKSGRAQWRLISYHAVMQCRSCESCESVCDVSCGGRSVHTDKARRAVGHG